MLYRKLIEWGWYKDSAMVHLLIHFLLLANHKENVWQGHVIKAGQFITGLESLSKSTGISRQTIRTCINRLILTGEITNKSTNKNRLITIVNWAQYQSSPDKLTSTLIGKVTNNQQAANKQLTANKNDKNDKNIRTPLSEVTSDDNKERVDIIKTIIKTLTFKTWRQEYNSVQRLIEESKDKSRHRYYQDLLSMHLKEIGVKDKIAIELSDSDQSSIK
jgi:hypothetical protein